MADNNKKEESKVPDLSENDNDVDRTIHCFFTLSDYREDILGYGISFDPNTRTFSTPGELVSYEAFYDHKVRESGIEKLSFSHWIPAFINLTHVCQNDEDDEDSDQNIQNNQNKDVNNVNIMETKWYKCLSKSIEDLAIILDNYVKDDPYFLTIKETVWIKVLCKLIVDMLIAVMQGHKHASLTYFEALCSFWRTLYWYIHNTPTIDDDSEYNKKYKKEENQYYINNKKTDYSLDYHKYLLKLSLKQRIGRRLSEFVTYEECRHKDYNPDLGHILIIYSVLTDIINENSLFKREEFIDAYLFEANIRSVRWWKDKNISETDDKGVFKNTQIGRNLFLFEILFLDDIVHMGQLRRKKGLLSLLNKNENTNEMNEIKEENNEISNLKITSHDTAKRLDETNGKLPKLLEMLQNDFKQCLLNISDYYSYWNFVGASNAFIEYHAKKRDICEWIKLGVKMAKEKGPRYYPAKLHRIDQNEQRQQRQQKQKQSNFNDYYISDVYQQSNNDNNNNNEYRDPGYNNSNNNFNKFNNESYYGGNNNHFGSNIRNNYQNQRGFHRNNYNNHNNNNNNYHNNNDNNYNNRGRNRNYNNRNNNNNRENRYYDSYESNQNKQNDFRWY